MNYSVWWKARYSNVKRELAKTISLSDSINNALHRKRLFQYLGARGTLYIRYKGETIRKIKVRKL